MEKRRKLPRKEMPKSAGVMQDFDAPKGDGHLEISEEFQVLESKTNIPR